MYGCYLGEKFPIIKAPDSYFVINSDISEEFLNSCRTYTEFRSIYNHSFINGLNNQDMFAGLMCLMNVDIVMNRLDMKHFFDKVKERLALFPVIDTLSHVVERNQNFGHVTFCVDKSKILKHVDVAKLCSIPIDMPGSEFNGVSAYMDGSVLTGMPSSVIYTRDTPVIPPDCYSLSLKDLHDCQSTQDRTERLFLSISIEMCKEGIPIPAYVEPPKTVCDRIPKAPKSELKDIIDTVSHLIDSTSYSMNLEVDKSDASIYEDIAKAKAYVKDSFKIRVADILSIILLLKDKNRIVAPGDGIGTVWSACAYHKRLCYSSDSSKVMTDIGHTIGTGVKHEDFDKTLSIITSDDIVILSHCVQFIPTCIARVLERTKKLIVFEHDTVYDGASLLIPLRDTFRYIRHSHGMVLRNIPIKTSLDNRLVASVPKWTDMYVEGATYFIDDPSVLPMIEMWRFWGSKVNIAAPIDKYLLTYLSTLGITPSPYTDDMIGLFKRRVVLGVVVDPMGRSLGRVQSARDVMFGNLLTEDDYICDPPMRSSIYDGPVLVSAKGHSNCSSPPIDFVVSGVVSKVHYVTTIPITYIHSDSSSHGEISLSASKSSLKRKVVSASRRKSLRDDHESSSKRQRCEDITITISGSQDDNAIPASAGPRIRRVIRESKLRLSDSET